MIGINDHSARLRVSPDERNSPESRTVRLATQKANFRFRSAAVRPPNPSFRAIRTIRLDYRQQNNERKIKNHLQFRSPLAIRSSEEPLEVALRTLR